MLGSGDGTSIVLVARGGVLLLAVCGPRGRRWVQLMPPRPCNCGIERTRVLLVRASSGATCWPISAAIHRKAMAIAPGGISTEQMVCAFSHTGADDAV